MQDQFDNFTVVIDKTTILNNNFSIIKNYIEENWDVGFSTLNICIYGYDNDPRELYEIPEVVKWVNHSIYQEEIPWFYILSNNHASQSIKLIALCYCSIETKTKDDKIKYQLDFNKLQEFALINFSIMNNFIKKNNINEVINQEISQKVSIYLRNCIENK